MAAGIKEKGRVKSEKKFTLYMSVQQHKKMKARAALREQTIREYLLSLLENDEEDYEFEELDEEDLKDIEQAEKDIAAGNYKTLEQVKEEYKCQS